MPDNNQDKVVGKIEQLTTYVPPLNMFAPKFFINTTFTGHYPVGTAAVIRANNIDQATEMLNKALDNIGLTGDVESWQLTCISDATENSVIVLCDGNY